MRRADIAGRRDPRDPESVPPQDDPRSGGPAGPEQIGPWPPTDIPDDISELAPDVEAYRREQRAAARRAAARARRSSVHPAIRWLLPSGREPAPGFVVRDRRFRLPMFVTAAALVMAVIVTVLLTVLAPTQSPVLLRALPLASPTAHPGQVRGLLPDITVDDVHGQPVALRAIRPAVVVLLPGGCDCSREVGLIAQDAASQGVGLAAVTDPGVGTSPPEVQSVQSLVAFSDPAGATRQALNVTGLTSVVVLADGTIYDIVPGTGHEAVAQLSNDLQTAFAGR